jgi:hypothetical protein
MWWPTWCAIDRRLNAVALHEGHETGASLKAGEPSLHEVAQREQIGAVPGERYELNGAS